MDSAILVVHNIQFTKKVKLLPDEVLSAFLFVWFAREEYQLAGYAEDGELNLTREILQKKNFTYTRRTGSVVVTIMDIGQADYSYFILYFVVSKLGISPYF